MLFGRLKDLEEVMLIAIRPLLQVSNNVHNRSRVEPTDKVLAGQSKCLVDSFALISQAAYKTNIMRVSAILITIVNSHVQH